MSDDAPKPPLPLDLRKAIVDALARALAKAWQKKRDPQSGGPTHG